MTWRQRKKLFYGIVFVNIILICLILIVLIFRPKASCFDRKQNQGEKGIDCGGPCISCDVFELSPIKIFQAKYLNYKDGSMDLIAEIENSNPDYGVKEFDYKFTINGVNGEIREATGKSFALPKQRKYILIANRQSPDFSISSVSLSMNFPRENWSKLLNYEIQEIKIDLLNYEFLFEKSFENENYDIEILNDAKSLKAEIINSGNTEYFDIALKFLILDENEDIIGTAISEIPSIEPMERQTINLTLPPLLGIPQKVIFEPESNIFE